MNILLSEQTSISTEPASDNMAEAGSLAGARFRQAKCDGDPDLYIPTTFANIDKLLDVETRHLHVMGHTEEELQREIEERHPSPRAEAKKVIRVDEVHVGFYKSMTRYEEVKQEYHQTKLGKCWVVLPKPLVEEANDVTELTMLSMSMGPILITRSLYNRMFGSTTARYMSDDDKLSVAEECGFTVAGEKTFGSSTFMQVNYNPRAMKYREFNRVKRDIVKRWRGEFTPRVLIGLYGALTPSGWPSSHPFYREVQGRDMYDRHGWGHQLRKDFTARQVLKLIAFNKRVYPSPWWRNKDSIHGGEFSSFQAVLKEAVLYVHEIERRAESSKEAWIKKFQDRYKNHQAYCRRYQENVATVMDILRLEGEGGIVLDDVESEDWRYATKWCPDRKRNVEVREYFVHYESRWPHGLADLWTEWFTSNPPELYTLSAEEFVASSMKAEFDHTSDAENIRLCRWVRNEAKIAGVTIPRPAKMPMSPAEKKRRAKARAKLRRQQARERRKNQNLHSEAAGDL